MLKRVCGQETALEQQLEAAQQKLRDLSLKDAEVDTLKTQLSVLQRSSSLAQIGRAHV